MKNRILTYLFGLIVLVIYTSLDVKAQVVKNPENPYHSIPLGVDSNINRALVAQFELKGSESQNFNDLLHLQFVQIELHPDFINKTQAKKIEFSYELFGVATKILADIDNYGNVNLNSNIILTPVFNTVKVYILDLNSKNLTLGDTFFVKIKLGIAKGGETPNEYLEVDPQFLFYGKKEIATTGIHSLEEPVVSIYPNPFVNLINVDLPKIENIVIINKLGQQVYTGSSNDPIETANFPSGEYFIQTSYGFKKVIK